MRSQRYRMYGLTLRSEVPLPAPLAPSSPVDVDLYRSSQERFGSFGARVLAQLTLGHRQVYTLWQHPWGYRLRFEHCCTLEFQRDLRKVWVIPHAGVPLSLVGQVLVGSVPTTVLTLSGEWVLHASAVETFGQALAFAGDAGAGKTTLAAAFCAQGFGLITDDLLRFQFRDDQAWAVPGTGRLRLRQDVVAAFPELPAKPIAEGRWEVIYGGISDPVPLGVLFLPQVSETVTRPEFRPLSPHEALFRLLGAVKLKPLKDKALLEARLQRLAQLVQRVPVVHLQVPRRLEALPHVVQEILARFAP